MIKFVRFEEANAGGYLAHNMILTSETEAEFKMVLQGSDKLVTTECGVELVRGGAYFIHVNKMNNFKGASFVDEGGNNIQLKLIEV